MYNSGFNKKLVLRHDNKAPVKVENPSVNNVNVVVNNANNVKKGGREESWGRKIWY